MTFASCFGVDLFILDTTVELTFNNAVNECISSHGATLASIPSEALPVVNELLETSGLIANPQGTDVWIGSNRPSVANNGDGRVPSIFDWIDGESDRSFFEVERGQEPWNDGKPNNNNGIEACVHLEFTFLNDVLPGNWDDGDCENESHILCRQKEAGVCTPTVRPTVSPTTGNPNPNTASPTSLPTLSPITPEPTLSPTPTEATQGPSTLSSALVSDGTSGFLALIALGSIFATLAGAIFILLAKEVYRLHTYKRYLVDVGVGL